MKTNLHLENDGFGENLKIALYTIFYCEFHRIPFFYSPFDVYMDHNYQKDPMFSKKLDRLINFDQHFPLCPPTEGKPMDTVCRFKLLSWYEQNIDKIPKLETFSLVKRYFLENKKDPYQNGKFNIAIHIRRKWNPSDENRSVPGSDVPDEVFLEIIQNLVRIFENKDYELHIFSQGKKENFKKFFHLSRLQFHIDEPIEKTFLQMVMADVLVMSPSSLSYSAGFFSNGTIYYMKHCNPPLSGWNIVDGYQSSRKSHEFLILISVIYDPKEGKFYTQKKEKLELDEQSEYKVLGLDTTGFIYNEDGERK